VRLLIGGLLSQHPLESLDGRFRLLPALLVKTSELDQQSKKRLPKLLTAALCPLLVAIFRQQLTGVQVNRRSVGSRLTDTASDDRGLLENLDVHPQRCIRTQRELFFSEKEVARSTRCFGRLEGTAGIVEYLVEVVCGSSRVQIWPQEIHHPLAMHSVAWREGEQLQKARRLPEAPSALIDLAIPHCDRKAA
jgi:hypothetical protein